MVKIVVGGFDQSGLVGVGLDWVRPVDKNASLSSSHLLSSGEPLDFQLSSPNFPNNCCSISASL